MKLNTPIFVFYLLLLAVMVLGSTARDEDTGFTGQGVAYGTENYRGWNGPGSGLMITALIGLFSASFLVANRIYWRVKLVGGLGIDDWAIICAMAFFTVQSIATYCAVMHGYGTNSRYVPYYEIEQALLYFFILQIFYKLAINMVKISILSLYIRLFTPLWTRLICLGCLIICVIAMISFTFATIFQNIPIAAAFTPWNRPETFHSIDIGIFWKANAFWNIGSDVVLLFIPTVMIKHLNLSMARKFALTVMLSFGALVLAAAILRFTTLGDAANGSQDYLESSYVSTMWTQIEAALAVSCACLPMLKSLFACIFNCIDIRDPAACGIGGGLTYVNTGSLEASEEGRELDMLEPVGRAL